jgi:hypothetical protein
VSAAGSMVSARYSPSLVCIVWRKECIAKSAGKNALRLPSIVVGASGICAAFRRRLRTLPRLVLYRDQLPPRCSSCVGQECGFTHPHPPGRLEIPGS